jgi:predicted transcriptional regulator
MEAGALAGEDLVSCTIKDIARLAGVSTATVSRVTNGGENVSCERKAAVLSAISRLQYCPNAHAAELGRVNGRLPRRREIHASILARTRTELVSGPTVYGQNQRRQAERLSLLEDENARLKKLVRKIDKELEKWQRPVR